MRRNKNILTFAGCLDNVFDKKKHVATCNNVQNRSTIQKIKTSDNSVQSVRPVSLGVFDSCR